MELNSNTQGALLMFISGLLHLNIKVVFEIQG